MTDTRTGFIDGKLNVYFSNNSFESKWNLFNQMGHEYVHVANYIELGAEFNSTYSEFAAYMWNGYLNGNQDYEFYKNFYIEKYGKSFNPFGNLKDYGIKNKIVEPKYMNYGSYGLFTIIPNAYWSF